MDPSDLAALRHLSDRYADAVDRRDPAALTELFRPDGVLRVQPDGGEVEAQWEAARVAEMLETLAGYQATFHHVGGGAYEGGGDRATGRVRCLAHHYERTRSGPVDLVMMITYHDAYLRQEGEWLIRSRRVAVSWTEVHPAHPRPKGRR